MCSPAGRTGTTLPARQARHPPLHAPLRGWMRMWSLVHMNGWARLLYRPPPVAPRRSQAAAQRRRGCPPQHCALIIQLDLSHHRCAAAGSRSAGCPARRCIQQPACRGEAAAAAADCWHSCNTATTRVKRARWFMCTLPRCSFAPGILAWHKTGLGRGIRRVGASVVVAALLAA